MEYNIKRSILTCIKLIAAVTPFIWIFYSINLKELNAAISKVAWWTIPVFSINLIVAMFLQGFRWWVLLKAYIPSILLKKTISIHFKGLFYSIVLPTSAAQDVVRAALLSKDTDYKITWGSTWICRLLGLFILTLFSFYGLFFLDQSFSPKDLLPVICTLTGGIVVLFFISFSKVVTKRINPIFAKILPRKILHTIEDIREGVYLYRYKKGSIVKVLIITFIFQVIVVINSCLLIKGITGDFPLLECMAFIPIIEILCISLPLTPNGIGVRETFVALFFQYLKFSNEELGLYVIISLLAVILKLLGGLPVLYGYIRNKAPKKVLT